MILKLFVGTQVVELFGTQEVVSRRLDGGNGVFFHSKGVGGNRDMLVKAFT